MAQSTITSPKWYEKFGSDLFTDVIGSFLSPTIIIPSDSNNHNNTNINNFRNGGDLASLLLSCKYIYGIFENCDEFWIKLFEKEYKNQLMNQKFDQNNDKEINLFKQESFQKQYLGKGKLMKAYFQIKYYERNVNLIPKECWNDRFFSGYNDDNMFIPRLVSTSNEGYIYSEGFCSQLCGGYFIEGYDPSYPDTYRNILDGQRLQIFSTSVLEEFQALTQQVIKTNHGMIYSLIIFNSDLNFDSVKVFFDELDNIFKNTGIGLDEYIISFGIHYGGKDQTYSENYKRDIERRLREYLTKFNVHDSIVMECNLYNREQVRELTRQTVNKIKIIDLCKFLPVLLENSKNKKKCSLM